MQTKSFILFDVLHCWWSCQMNKSKKWVVLLESQVITHEWCRKFQPKKKCNQNYFEKLHKFHSLKKDSRHFTKITYLHCSILLSDFSNWQHFSFHFWAPLPSWIYLFPLFLLNLISRASTTLFFLWRKRYVLLLRKRKQSQKYKQTLPY